MHVITRSLQDISPDIILLFTFSPQTTFSCNIEVHDPALHAQLFFDFASESKVHKCMVYLY